MRSILRLVLKRCRPIRPAAGLIVLLPFFGTWVGHTLEYQRVWGTTPDFWAEAFGSIHAYMLPAAAVLVAMATIFGARLFRFWRYLGIRLDATRSRLLAALLHRPEAMQIDDVATVRLSSRLALAWPVLALSQIGLYLVQENVEAAIGGEAVPGLGPLVGVHGLAGVVHAGVALFLTLAMFVVVHIFQRRTDAIHSVEAVLRCVLLSLYRNIGALLHYEAWAVSPLDIYGSFLYRRPPPCPSTA